MERSEDTSCHGLSRNTADPDARIGLSQAARIAPGGPSPNCVWRWCRRGVLARSGERVRLRHIRVGGKLFTSSCWLEEFFQRLADTDIEYFEIDADRPRDEQSVYSPPPRRRSQNLLASRRSYDDDAHRAKVRAELEAEGL